MMKILLILLTFSSTSWACIPSNTLRPIIEHRREFLLKSSNMTAQVPVDPNAIEILDSANDYRTRSNEREEQVEESEITVTEPTLTTTTSTFKPDTIDDPNFIPGNFLDSYGNDVVQPPPPLKDVLADFLERTEVKKSKFWTILAIFLFAIGSQVITIIIYTWTFALIIPLYNLVMSMKTSLPLSQVDKLKAFNNIASLFLSDPKRFSKVQKSEMPKKKPKKTKKPKKNLKPKKASKRKKIKKQ